MTLRLYRVLRSCRLRGRVLWEGDKIMLRADEAVDLVKAGDLVLVEANGTRATSWGEPMVTR